MLIVHKTSKREIDVPEDHFYGVLKEQGWDVKVKNEAPEKVQDQAKPKSKIRRGQ